MFRITYSQMFVKHYKKLIETEKKQFKSKLNMFIENPFHPSLRTKRIQGTDDLFEFSVNMDTRVIWQYEDSTLIALIDIGHHDVLRNY